MSGDLISRAELVEWLTKHTGFRGNCENCTDIDCVDCIIENAVKRAPAVEAEPVVHAHWIMRGGRRYCSACGTMACVTRDSDDFWYTVGTKRCPECGAHMDEEVADV